MDERAAKAWSELIALWHTPDMKERYPEAIAIIERYGREERERALEEAIERIKSCKTGDEEYALRALKRP